jgi:hypothetical protein
MLAKHPDPTVDHVLKTWAPRMIVQGIDYNDLMTTGARIGTWEKKMYRKSFLPSSSLFDRGATYRSRSD